MALDLEEIDSYKFWVLAQQEPKKFQWSSSDKAGTREPHIGDSIIRFAQKKMKAEISKGDIWTLAKSRGMQPIYQVEKGDGKTVFVNESGDEVDSPIGMTFVKSKALEDNLKDKRIFVRES